MNQQKNNQPGEQGRLVRIAREKACEGSILDLYQDTVRLPDGREEKWDYVHHKKGGGACIVPVLPDGRILLVRQYRPAIDEELVELPAGARDSLTEDTAVTAKRELQEETGYASDHWQSLVRILTDVSWCNEFTDIYLARDIHKVSSQHLDEAEDIRITCASLSDLLSRIYARQIQDAKTVAGILAYAALPKSQRSL